jgi:hypothetical protein
MASALACAASVFFPAGARTQDSAQAPASEQETPARNHFARGRAAYERGDFKVALDAFQAAYANTQHPKLLYNVGLASQKLGLVTEAVTAFESYLAWGEGDRAEEVRGRLAALRDLANRDAAFAAASVPTPAVVAAAQESAPATAPTPIHQAPERSEARSRKWWPWMIAGGVAAAVAVAIAVPLARKDGATAEPISPNTGLTIDALWRSR